MPSMADPTSVRKPGRLGSALVLLILLGSCATLVVLAAWRLGAWLVVPDPLKPARAIVVLNGSMPFRAMEAAKIYGQGWAPEVRVTRNAHPSETGCSSRLRVKAKEEDFYSAELLERRA